MDDIDALLHASASQLGTIRTLYEQSLKTQNLDPQLKPTIKNMLENHVSALDYLAERIHQKHGKPGTKAKIYYPLAYSPQAFPTWFEKNLPGVKANARKVYEAIRDRQPYESGYKWLDDLNGLARENKHRELTPQVKAWKPELVVDLESAGIAPVRIEPDPGTSMDPVQATEPILVGRDAQVGQTVGAAVIVDWHFARPPASVLGTLERIQRELPGLISAVRQSASV